MAAYGTGDQNAGQGTTVTLPNFVGELFKLSPLDTPLLSMIGGMTGGQAASATVFTWQDTLHRAPEIINTVGIAEGADATFSNQNRNERKNVVAIHQYGVELSYTKQAATGLLGSGGDSPTTAATSIIGTQPVQSEMAWQLQIKIEQAALDIEKMFLDGTYTFPNTGAARITQGIVGAVDAATSVASTAYGTTGNVGVDRAGLVIDGLAKAMYDNGAPLRNPVIMCGSAAKLDISRYYQQGNGNIMPRSYSVFGVNVTDIETDFGKFPIVLNRHFSDTVVGLFDLDLLAPKFLPIPGKGHFFLEPLAKSGAYDREQLYGEIGLEYGPAGWHGKATAWTTATA
jgi:hypothetical protein